MKQKKLIYYIPGMISLIVLPILGYLYLMPYAKEERCIDVVFCSKYEPNRDYSLGFRFDTTLLSTSGNKRVYYTIKLNGNEYNDKTRLYKYRLLVREIYKKQDVIHGVHLVFGDSVKYGTYIESINILKKESIPIFALYENNLWTFYYRRYDKEAYKKSNEETAIRKGRKINERISDKLTVKDQFQLMKKLWPVFLMLIILGVLSFKSVIKK